MMRKLVKGAVALCAVLLFAAVGWCGSERPISYPVTVKVVNGFADDSNFVRPTYTMFGCTGGAAYSYSDIEVWFDDSKGYFQKWSVSPATVDLGEEYDAFADYTTAFVGSTAVTLTANYVPYSRFGGYLCVNVAELLGDSDFDYDSASWSPDGGKSWLPFGVSYPVPAGTVTLSFKAPAGWIAPEKRALKLSSGCCDDDGELYVGATFVEAGSDVTTVLINANGGKTSVSKMFFKNRGEYAYYYSLPVCEPRAGYIFSHWSTVQSDAGGQYRVDEGDAFVLSLYNGARSPTLYAQWRKAYTLTVKNNAGMECGAYVEDDEDDGCSDCGYGVENGSISVLSGSRCSLWADEGWAGDDWDCDYCGIGSFSGGKQFQWWTVSPATVSLGAEFNALDPETSFVMPAANVTFTPEYIDGSNSGLLTMYAVWDEGCGYDSPDYLMWDDDWDDDDWDDYDDTVYPDESDLEWSPDGGKHWVKSGYSARLKAGTYTITWRSLDPNWTAPTTKPKMRVWAESETDNYYSCDTDSVFLFSPLVVVDVETEGGPGVGGVVVLNPANGRLAPQKGITLTAKPNSGYFFQGFDYPVYSSLSSYKLQQVSPCMADGDGVVHVTALFKHRSSYVAEDLYEGISLDSPSGEKSLEFDSRGRSERTTCVGVVGCSYHAEFEVDTAAAPVTYKLSGTLPSGLKLDAKAGTVSGVPTKQGYYPVEISIADPAGHVAVVRLTFEIRALPQWMVGDYRALMHGPSDSYGSCNWVCDEDGDCWESCEEAAEQCEGILELSVTAAGKVSGKLIRLDKTTTFTGNIYWEGSDDEEEGEESFGFDCSLKNGYCWGTFSPEGLSEVQYDEYYAVSLSTPSLAVVTSLTGEAIHADKTQMQPFADRYYTMSLVGDTDDEGYGYLTLKVAKTGAVSVAGVATDGSKVTAATTLLPDSYGEEAHVLFYAPVNSKKGAVYADLLIASDGYVSVCEAGHFRKSSSVASSCSLSEPDHVISLDGWGNRYSTASSLLGYYWDIVCAWDGRVTSERSVTEYGETYFEEIEAVDLGDFFNVSLKGDRSGISLAMKSPAPWKETETWYEPGYGRYTSSWWNYDSDKNGNEITDPSQLKFSFNKATGVFSGSANVYFDWEDNRGQLQHMTASVPYAGVFISDEDSLIGYGAAIYTSKHTDYDCSGRKTSETCVVSLPVLIEEGGCRDCVDECPDCGLDDDYYW